ncbi:MAG: 4Fe-4S binding protein [Bacteroidales bacterium]|jgi:ferredoxin|nr:4Fe-4S binding protein [Bacteroidales bacterium]
MELIKINSKKCVHCYACVKSCPTKAITMQIASDELDINHERCIGCGNCYVSCGIKAVEYLKTYKNAAELLKTEKESIAIVDPSIASEFPDILDYRNFVGMIRILGFNYINEISFGADIVSLKYKEKIDNFKGKYLVTTNCPPVVEYIEKFQPHIIDSLIPVVSPIIATAKILRQIHGENAIIIAITPCLAQKKEVKKYENLVNEVISFEELRILFNENNIYENSVEFSEFDQPIGKKGSLYPLSTGILDASDINYTPLINRIVTREGQENFTKNIDDFANINEIKHHLNIFYCKGCNMGPCSSHNKSYLLNHSLVVNYTTKRLGLLDNNEWEKNIELYKETDLSRSFSANDQRIPKPAENKITEVLKLIGKEKYTETGCKTCGYDNCHDFATDVAKGLVKPEMCVNFTLRNRQEFINKITAANTKLAETQRALEESEQKIRKEHEDAKESITLIKAILAKIPSGVVIVDDKLKIIQSNQKFIDLIGQDAKEINDIIPGLIGADVKTLLPHSVYNIFSYISSKNKEVDNKDIEFNDKLISITAFPIKRDRIFGAVFRDMYQPEVRKDELIERINDVIEKNLGMVQQIGFLLGEGASETERMLNSIISSFEKSNDNK